MNDRADDPNQPEEIEDFAALLEQSLKTPTRLQRGRKTEATILQIGQEWTFLDVGQKGEGILATSELLNSDGEITAAVGDQIGAYFLSNKNGEPLFTMKLGGGQAGTEQLEQAWQGGIPVEGRIEKEIKGGFEIKLPGAVRAFCPFSQMGLRREENNEQFIGLARPFRITKFEEQGRNIVVSHRALLEEQQQQQRETLKETLKSGDRVKGTITSIRDFGAFVDIGGIEGLLPISEISHSRVENIEDVLRVGQELELILKSCDWDANRFSFSLRDTLADPWSQIQDRYRTGNSYPGTVSRLAPFGAFVTLEDGIDGLLHISKIAEGKRLRHAQEALELGQKIEVVIERIEIAEKRLSLAMSTDNSAQGPSSYSDPVASSGMGSLGDLMRASQEKKQRKRK